MTCSSSSCRRSTSASTQPGTTPAEPAVGAATITPMVAERSSTAMARATASVWTVPIRLALKSLQRVASTSLASPPISPPSERCGLAMGAVVSSRMTSSTRRMAATAWASPVRRASRTAMTAPMLSPSSSHASSSCSPSSKISLAETPGESDEAEPGSSIKVA